MVPKFLNLLITLVHLLDFLSFILSLFHVISGIQVEYLPPYSPDLNPIEEAFSKIKHWIRHHQDYYGAAKGDRILFDMYEVMDIITPSDAEGYFVHAGYF
jgi:hypothetical protein